MYSHSYRIAVLGLGYVGLPVAIAFAEVFPETVGFDIKLERVEALKQGIDITGEIDNERLKNSPLNFTASLQDLKDCNFYIVAVPTPVDKNNQPNLTPLIKASELLGKVIKPGDIIVYESTVYPGVTEEICGKILSETSGLKQNIDFKLGYSPERINPGDKSHTLEKIVKVVSGEDEPTLNSIAEVYSKIIQAGVYRAPSIKVAESAKVIENIQRDLNIALMNELAIIFDHLNIRTQDVLNAAKTKWNFLPFTPGLVGGHCIGVDPYYLTAKAEEMGYHPQVILAGRRINDSMGTYLAQRLVKLLIQANCSIPNAKVGILGLTFKENVPDLRNSRVPDIVAELNQFGIQPLIHDPFADPVATQQEYAMTLVQWSDLLNLDAMILAVPHQTYLDLPLEQLLGCLGNQGVLMDVKSVLNPNLIPSYIHYWSL
ncbi:nucleotide sugar dehydrogenase [Planktothrix mougeotii]|uniref:Nucleotide sugar dehydrogenase n=1 Tax=Planktothrix mougeotii LEGE 06226 TaxID=1828728 RepID=A0ABR9UDT8_9CYAN|nr:nucleotide sugar dehydrogenase [Planktothrix mougeotii]MBE9144597.1 nucleotide sugar dehydrogenase [Planktothrix mougeotii LEGE 06226]